MVTKSAESKGVKRGQPAYEFFVTDENLVEWSGARVRFADGEFAYNYAEIVRVAGKQKNTVYKSVDRGVFDPGEPMSLIQWLMREAPTDTRFRWMGLLGLPAKNPGRNRIVLDPESLVDIIDWLCEHATPEIRDELKRNVLKERYTY